MCNLRASETPGLLASPERAEEIFTWNSFPGLSRADAVRAPAPAAQTPVPGRNR